MKINLILGLALIVLSMIALPGNSFITADLQVVFSSSIEETSENEQQGDANDNGNGASVGGEDDANDNGNGASVGGGGDDANDNDGSNQKLTDAISIRPSGEDLSEEQQQQQQVQRELTMEIINSNGLIPVNDTSSMDKSGGDGVGNGDNSPTAQKVTCVKNDRGEVFCYEELKPIEHCLKPIEEEDPPLCLRGQ